MSTRAGKFISADELVEEVTRRAFEEVSSRREDLDLPARQAIARSVALATIRCDIVKISPDKSTVFDWKQALDFERQSGPYIQYAHATYFEWAVQRMADLAIRLAREPRPAGGPKRWNRFLAGRLPREA